MCMTFASLAWCHMTFLLSLFFCFHPQYLKLLRCVSSPQGIPPHILPAIHLLTSLLLFGAFVIVALMHADSDCWTIFSLFPLLSALSPLLLWLAFTLRGSLHCCLLLRAAEGRVCWFSPPCQRCFWSSFSC